MATSPFSPLKKRSAVAIMRPDKTNEVVIYVKGAPEIVNDLCTHYDDHDNVIEFGEDER